MIKDPNERIKELEDVLEDVLEEIEGYVDVVDGDYGEQKPNWAMSLTNRIEFALGRRPGP